MLGIQPSFAKFGFLHGHRLWTMVNWRQRNLKMANEVEMLGLWLVSWWSSPCNCTLLWQHPLEGQKWRWIGNDKQIYESSVVPEVLPAKIRHKRQHSDCWLLGSKALLILNCRWKAVQTDWSWQRTRLWSLFYFVLSQAQFHAEYGWVKKLTGLARRRLLDAAEEAKLALSTEQNVQVVE